MNIHIKTIPHGEQRYPTVGDWWKESGVEEVRVSDMQNADYEFLVFIHEVIEWYIAERRGIPEKDVDAYDMAFEALRSQYPEIIGNQEPGFMESCPVRREHEFADKIERMVAGELSVDWDEYDRKVNSL